MKHFALLFLLLLGPPIAAAGQPPPAAAPDAALLNQIALRIWHNEGAGKREYLTYWSKNEPFPSLGIGHFLWYPKGRSDRFEEQFPALLDSLKLQGIPLPDWLSNSDGCPWPDRQSFYADFDGPRLRSLRQLLSDTLPQQAAFILQRFNQRSQQMLADSSAAESAALEGQLKRLRQSATGFYALLDYSNFKGLGTSQNERYQGLGWGLKQVLLEMSATADNPPAEFARAAGQVLRRRVANAPKDESRWLPGWIRRVQSYAEPGTTVSAGASE